jgi:hypothetical protein
MTDQRSTRIELFPERWSWCPSMCFPANGLFLRKPPRALSAPWTRRSRGIIPGAWLRVVPRQARWRAP